MGKMKIVLGDVVKVITGQSKGVIGKVLKVSRQDGSVKVFVDGANLKKKGYGKGNGRSGFYDLPGPIDISNVEFVRKKDPKDVEKIEDSSDVGVSDIGDKSLDVDSVI